MSNELYRRPASSLTLEADFEDYAAALFQLNPAGAGRVLNLLCARWEHYGISPKVIKEKLELTSTAKRYLA